jgi:hypothetical protein
MARKPAARKPSARKPLSFDDVRELGLALPEVEEVTAWGASGLKAAKTLMACEAVNKSAEPSSLMVRISLEDRDRLLKDQPDVYYLTPHYEPYPCVLARLPKIRRDDLRELLGASWRFVMERTPARKAAKKRGVRAAQPKPT